MYNHCLPVVFLLGILSFYGDFGLVARSAEGSAAVINYQRDVLPILKANCFECHGADQQENGLRLDIKSRALLGGDGGRSIIPGKSAESELIRRVISRDEQNRMPSEGEPLTDRQVNILRTWIDQGAKGIPEQDDSLGIKHWAFEPVGKQSPPTVHKAARPRNPIDLYILSELERQKVQPAETASHETLIRRLSLDLIGLTPSWERVAEFVADDRPNAYEHLVEELLSSPHYGERWGRHWLDLARYADSTGYESDKPREIWAYRDWVIQALNNDMPFDRFVIAQIAGDLLPSATPEDHIATGFHCNAMLDGGVRHESIIDRVNTTGAVFLGLTTGCAQCHSHKTDPLTQREFYQLYAFFNEASVETFELSGRKDAQGKPLTTLVMKSSPRTTNIFVRGDHTNLGEKVEPGFPDFLSIRIASSEQSGVPKGKVTRLDLAKWLVSRDNPLTARVTVNRIWQHYFGLGLVETQSDFGMQTSVPTHRALLDFLAGELQGEKQWKGFKHLHRLIVTSATYRQSSRVRRDLLTTDPRNRLFARQQRLRLESEILRDIPLTVSGLLSRKIGGPSVFPPQPDDILNSRATPAQWKTSEGEDRYRRGMYTWFWRLTPYPHLPLFDAPDGVTSCSRRDRSNVPVQALTLLNDPTYVEFARGLAARLLQSNPGHDDQRKISWLFRECLSRDPQKQESRLIAKLLISQRSILQASPENAVKIIGRKTEFDAAEQAAWVVVCRTILNLDEFMTRE